MSNEILGVVIQLGTLASVLVAIIGLLHGVRTYKRQTNAQIFLEYTRRYEEIMSALPLDALNARLASSGEPPALDPVLTTMVLKYLNMCSEEFYLWRRKYLATEVWRIWEKEMKRTFRSPLFRREWLKLQVEFEAYSEFTSYVTRVQLETDD